MKNLLILSFLFFTLICCDDLPVNQSKIGDRNVTKGSQLMLDGDYEEAEAELRSALYKEFRRYSKQEFYTILGNLYNEMEEWDSSIYYHQRAIELDSNYTDAWVNLGIVYRLTSEFEKAEACYMKAMAINPNDAELHGSLGSLNYHKGNIQKAINHLERCIELNYDLPVAHANYSLALASIGDYKRAEDELRIAISMGYKNGALVRERIEELKEDYREEE